MLGDAVFRPGKELAEERCEPRFIEPTLGDGDHAFVEPHLVGVPLHVICAEEKQRGSDIEQVPVSVVVGVVRCTERGEHHALITHSERPAKLCDGILVELREHLTADEFRLSHHY